MPTFPAVVFANTNIPEKRFRVCLDESEIKDLPENSTDIFKKNMVDRYVDRPDLMFAAGKYSVTNQLCYPEFLRYYSLIYKSRHNDNQPEELTDHLLEANSPCSPVNCPKILSLTSSKEKLHSRKVPYVLGYHAPNKHKYPEQYAHHLLFLFYPFRDESPLLSECDGTYTSKLIEQHILEVVNWNKLIIEPDGDIVDSAFSIYKMDHLHNMDSFAQQENEETKKELELNNTQEVTEETSSSDCNIDFSVSGTSSVPADCGVTCNIRSLNRDQRNVFDAVHRWARNYVKCRSSKTQDEVETMRLFITGGRGCGKSHLLRTIYQAVMKTLMYNGGDPDKLRVLLLTHWCSSCEY